MSTITPHMVNVYTKCSSDPIYFIENYCVLSSIDGTGTILLSEAQKKYVLNMHNNRLSSTMAHRQFGKTLLGAAYVLWFSLFNSNKTLMIGSWKQVQSAEAIAKIKELYTHIPSFLKPKIINNSKYELQFDNGSLIRAASSSINNYRGMTISLLFLDEFAYIENQDELFSCVMPCLCASEGKMILSSTLNRRDDLFWKIHHEPSSFETITLTWKDNPNIDETQKDNLLRCLGYKNFYKEYECKIHTLNELYQIINDLSIDI